MSDTEAAPPVPEWRRAGAALVPAAPANRKRLLWLMSQLLERRLAQSAAARDEKSDEPE